LTSSEAEIVIAGLGAATAIGRTAWASAAAVRAGISGFGAHPYMVDAVGLPMLIASLPWIDPERGIVDRIGDALVSALREALEPLPPDGQPRPRVSVLINLPAQRPGIPADLAQRVSAMVTEHFPGVFDRIGIAPLGHAGALVGVRSALAILREQPDHLCIVAGADSYIEPDLLEWLERTDQLHSAGERNNAWGFIPGEGAGALLLATPEALSRLECVPFGRLRSVGIGRETELIGTGTVCLGEGLTAAIREAIASGLRAGETVTDVYCDMNGEPYRADEYAFLVARTREHFAAASEFVSPADCWGDVGAASAPLLTGLACIAGTKGYSKGDVALVWASSVGGERAAALIETARAGTA
jgi:3-oxoacyl-[acyl-carrier-protein] synthase-1